MVYTVGEMAKKLDVPASTLRYYDKEGLLPFVERSSGGIRMFQESDFEWLQVIGCWKKAGLSSGTSASTSSLPCAATTPSTRASRCSRTSVTCCSRRWRRCAHTCETVE